MDSPRDVPPREDSPREPALPKASLCEGGVNDRNPPLADEFVLPRDVSLADERALLLVGGVNDRLPLALCPPRLLDPALPLSRLAMGVPALGFAPAAVELRASFMPPSFMRPPACTDDT
jgi:hypothetical protein